MSRPIVRSAETRLCALIDRIAAGEVVPDVQRCILRIESRSPGDVWTDARGVAEPETQRALTPHDPFRAASVTKTVTATTLLRLCDSGGCNREDSLGDYLPQDLVERIHVIDSRSYGFDISLRQLLDHTSGLPDFFGTAAVQDAIRHGNGERRFAPSDLVELAISDAPPSFPPGTGRSYTDTGFVLAGLIVEKVTGHPLHQAYRELVLDPAGMDSTWLESSVEPPRGGSVSHHVFEGVDITGSLDPTVDWAGGGLVSTAADLAALMRVLRDGKLLTIGAWTEMTTWLPGPTGFYDHYGLGLGRYEIGDVEAVGHHGIWGAFTFWVPAPDIIIAGTLNTGRVDRRPVIASVIEAVTAEC